MSRLPWLPMLTVGVIALLALAAPALAPPEAGADTGSTRSGADRAW